MRLGVRVQDNKSTMVSEKEKEALEKIMKDYQEKIMPAYNTYRDALKAEKARMAKEEKMRVSE